MTGDDPVGTPVSGTDTAEVDEIHPRITLVNTVGTGVYPGGELAQGTNETAVTYWFVVTNPGDVTLTNVVVTNAALNFSQTFGSLAAGQSVTVSVVSTISADLTNTAVATGYDPAGNPTSANDPSEVDLIAPALSVAKTVNGEEFAQGTNGTPVTYRFVVNNGGDVTLTNVVVDDPALGFNQPVGTLAAGQSVTVTAAAAISGDLTNTVNVTGGDPVGTPVSGTDTAEVDEIHPRITLVNTVGTGVYPGGELAQGTNETAVTYWFVVTNPGDVTLTNVVVTNAALNFSQTLGSLAAGQSVTVSVVSTISADLTNTAVATGYDPAGNPTSANDPSEVDLIAPALSVAKTVNGEEFAQGTNGTPVTYRFVVNNGGDVTLTNVVVDDPALGFNQPVGTLAAGQSVTVTAAAAISGDLTNTVNVTGGDPVGTPVSGTDTAEVDEIHPRITLVNTVGTGVYPGGELAQGTNETAVTYWFVVTNPGDVTLTNVVVTNAALNFSQTFGSLAAGQSVTVSVVSTISADLTNTAVATGYDPAGNPTSANDPSEVDLIAPALSVAKTVNGTELVQGTNGTPVTYRFVVNNGGDVTLTNVVVDDPALGFNQPVGTLAAGQSVTVTAAAAISGDLTNTVNVTGGDPVGTPVSGTDTAEVDEIHPRITLVNTVGTGVYPGGELAQGTNETAVTYWFVVTNPGDVTLTNVVVTNAALNFSQTFGSFAAGQSVTVSVVSTISADLTNTAVATGYDPAGNPTSANDPSEVKSITPSISVVKTADQATDGAIDYVLPGSNVVYTYRVVNIGNTYLMNVVVTDNVLGVVGMVPGVMAPNTTNYLYKTNVNTRVGVTNLAVVVGTPAFSSGVAIPGIDPVTHSDDAVVQVFINLALASRGSTITGNNGANWSNLTDGVTTGYTGTTGFGYTYWMCAANAPGNMTLDLKSLCTISSMKLLLWDLNNRSYRYLIQASSDNATWATIVNRTTGAWQSWQDIALSPTITARYLRVIGTYNSDNCGANNGFHVVEWEVYGTPIQTILTSANAVIVPEGGGTATFQVKLNTIIAGVTTVTVSRLSGDTNITVQSGGSLVFNASNWNTYQTVMLGAGPATPTNASAVIRCSAPGIANTDLTAAALYNLALASRGSTITGDNGANWSNLIDGVTTNYNSSTGFGYTYWKGVVDAPGIMTLDLKDPCAISTMKLLLWDLDNRYYRYKIEASIDNATWTMIVDRRTGTWQSWQGIAFSPTITARYLRVIGTYNSDNCGANNGFHVAEWEVYGSLSAVTYTITPVAGTNGSILPPTAVIVDACHSTSFVVRADPGYYIASVLTNGAPVNGVAGLYAYTSWWNHVQARGAIAAAFVSVTSDTATNGTQIPWLRQYYTNEPDIESLKRLANEDTDGDGMVNWKEFWSRTDPTDSHRFLYIIDAQNASNLTGSVIRWTSETGVVYRLKRSTNLVTDLFTTLVITNIPATPPINVETDKTDVGTAAWYYRINVEH